MDGFILSIDQGTSGTKAMIFDRSGSVTASTYCKVTPYYPQPGWVEQDANEIWEKTIQAVQEAIKNARILPEDIQGIGITNQRASTVLWNKKSGAPLGRAIIWQDRRTQKICEQIENRDRNEIERRTGITLVPNASSTKIKWLLEEDRTVQKALSRGELLFGTIDSWLIWKLSGGTVHVTDHSNASTTGMLNAETLKYDEWILEKFGIPLNILPGLKSSSEVYAYTNPQIFFGAKIPISGCAGDQSAAAFGQACFKKGMIKNTYGTGAFTVLNTGEQFHTPQDGIIAPVLWSLKGHTTFGLEGYADVSGAVLQWLHEGVELIKDPAEADGLAMQVTDTQGVYFIPALVGLGAPHHSPNARGTIFGIHPGTTKSHITRAAIEAMAYQTRDSFECIESCYGMKFQTLRADGGGAKSDFLLQFQADILGLPVERPVIAETSSLGAAFLAGLAVRFWGSIDEIEAIWKLDTRFEPRISPAKREDLYAGWVKAVECAKNWGDGSKGAETIKTPGKFGSLSPREHEVVQFIASGKSTHEIAQLLYTSHKTVEKQRHDAMKKLGVNNIAGLIRLYIEMGGNREN